MDSINNNQSEDNYEDLSGKQGRDKLKELIEKASSCFFCTNFKTGSPFTTRPMAVQKTDDEGNIWFLSSDDSHKNDEITHDPLVQLLFQGSPHSDFLSVSGRAFVSKDKEKIEELWNPLLKTWFTGGVDDSRITVIKVIPDEGYYWDTKHAQAVAFVKRLVGAVIGKTIDDSIEGSISVR